MVAVSPIADVRRYQAPPRRSRRARIVVVPELTGSIPFVGVSDLDRADDFYGRALGLTLRDERPFALVAELGATMLRITAVDEVVAAPYTVAGFVVTDIDAAVDALVRRGVWFIVYDGMGQD